MAINKNRYDGVHFQVVTMNMRDGSVQGHAAGCADLKRGKAKFAEPEQANDVMDVLAKHDAWLDYNADFIAECEADDEAEHAEGNCVNAYEIDWLPCANHVPAHREATDEELLGGIDAAVEAGEMEVFTPATTMKVCGKWTRFYQNGVEVGRVSNDAAEAVFAMVTARTLAANA